MQQLAYRFGGFLVFLLAVYLGGTAFAGHKLDGLIEKANENGNELTIGERELSFRFTHLGLSLAGVRLDQAVGERRISGTVSHVELGGLSLLKLLGGGDLSASELAIDGFALEVRPNPSAVTAATGKDGGPKNISVAELRLLNGAVSVFDAENGLRAEMLGVRSTAALTLPLAPATAPKISLQIDSVFMPGRKEADHSFSRVELDGEARRLTVAAFQSIPRKTARNFLTTVRYRTPWQALRVDDLTVEELPLDSLLTGGTAVFPDVTIGDFNLAVFENPTLERDPAEARKPFPVEAFRQIGHPVLLRHLRVDRAGIAYGNLKEGSDKPDITFAGTIDLKNLSTFTQDEPATATADFTLDGTAPLDVTFTLGQSADGRDFRAVGQLTDYDLPKVNPLLLVAAGADIESGHVHSLEHDFSVKGDLSTGKLTLKYEKLEVRMEGKNAWIINLIEDAVIRDSNPRNDGDLVIGQVNVDHDNKKSFFNLYWQSVVAGMTSSVAGNALTPDKLDSIE